MIKKPNEHIKMVSFHHSVSGVYDFIDFLRVSHKQSVQCFLYSQKQQLLDLSIKFEKKKQTYLFYYHNSNIFCLMNINTYSFENKFTIYLYFKTDAFASPEKKKSFRYSFPFQVSIFQKIYFSKFIPYWLLCFLYFKQMHFLFRIVNYPLIQCTFLVLVVSFNFDRD